MLRALATQLARHGRRIFEGIIQRGEQGIKVNPRNKEFNRFGPEQQSKEVVHTKYYLKSDLPGKAAQGSWVQRFIGSNNKNTVQGTRRKANEVFGSAQNRVIGQQLVTGGKLVSLYALAGLYMKSGTQEIELRDDQFDHICQEIQGFMKPYGNQDEKELTKEDIQLANLELGPLIAKGANSAVYSARLVDRAASEIGDEMKDTDDDISVISEPIDLTIDEQDQSNSAFNEQWEEESDIIILDNMLEELEESDEPLEDSAMNLAVKMMFNYDTQSDADEIIRAMRNEIIPARASEETSETKWNRGNNVKKKKLEPHPNIVDIRGFFVDEVPMLPDALLEYPDALPARINPEGSGHNLTMFLVMKRYDLTLRQYLLLHSPTVDESLFLLAQLLEAVVHLNRQQVAHRDLKSDNLLLNESNLDLVVSDFGCGLADKNFGLKVPYTSDNMGKGGNGALMAPEIACAEPGSKMYLDYRKSDLWTVGTLAYELFGCDNPFYRNSAGRRLDSRTYNMEDLPSLPDSVPLSIRQLIKSILHRDPRQRPSASEAANLVMLHILAPEQWLKSKSAPAKLDVIRWLLVETAGIMCHRSWAIQTNPVLSLKQCFLARISFDELMQAFSAIEM